MSKYTPGPWLRDGRTVYALNSTPENRFYVCVQGGFVEWNVRTPDTEIEAIARLIFLAPEMAEALREAVDHIRESGCYVCGGDCAAANPPVMGCPMQFEQRARAILAKLEAE